MQNFQVHFGVQVEVFLAKYIMFLAPNLMIWEKNYLFEKNCVFEFSKIALVCRMQISGAWLHAIAEMEWVHSSVTITTMTFKFIPNIPLIWSYQAIKV